jgi:glycosyltransferase involved in cell wall biosynthesis
LKIAQVLISDSWGSVTPEALNKGIGGREGALLYLSREWAKSGHEVTNFVSVEKGQRFYESYRKNDFYIDGKPSYSPGFHEYIPLNITKPHLANFYHDVVIAWETPSVFDEEQIRSNSRLKICEMQVCHLSDKERKAAEKYVDYMAVLSEWHGDLLQNSNVEMEKEKYVVFPNGVDITRYPKNFFDSKVKNTIRSNVKFVYSSSPDRGLWYLLQMWPLIREEFPKAELDVCYGVEKWTDALKWSHGRVGEMALEIESLIKQPGIKNLGKIGQDRLSELQLGADAWLYPLDSMSNTESGCISAVENAAAGNPIFTTDCDCMEDEFGDIGIIVDLPFNKDEFVEEVIRVLRDQEYMEHLRVIGRQFAEKRDWSIISEQWLNLFNKKEVK